LITRYGIPQTIISDNSLAFIGVDVTNFAMKYEIYWKTSSNYYPQGNGLAKSTNKNLIRILQKIMENNPQMWHDKLNWALWEDRIIVKSRLVPTRWCMEKGLFY